MWGFQCFSYWFSHSFSIISDFSQLEVFHIFRCARPVHLNDCDFVRRAYVLWGLCLVLFQFRLCMTFCMLQNREFCTLHFHHLLFHVFVESRLAVFLPETTATFDSEARSWFEIESAYFEFGIDINLPRFFCSCFRFFFSLALLIWSFLKYNLILSSCVITNNNVWYTTRGH